MKLDVGLRASRVNKNATGAEAGGTGTQLYGGFVPWPAAISQLVVSHFPVSARAYRRPEAIRQGVDAVRRAQYKIAPQAMAYFSYTRGFKAAGSKASSWRGSPSRDFKVSARTVRSTSMPSSWS